MGDHLRADNATHGGYGMPRGPIATPPENAPTAAIGFCPLCGANARGTCSNRGMFDCPSCTMFWYDDRVESDRGPQYGFDDFFVDA